MREMKSSLYSAFYVGILFTAGLNATITQGPSNTVGEIGKQVKLYCTADAPIAYWYLSNDTSGTGDLRIVGPGCGAVNAPFGNHYTIESTAGGTTCNLNIFDLTMEQAGVYKCVEGISPVKASVFTVIDPNPSITVTNGTGVVAGDQVTMSYTVRYNTSTSTASSETPTIQPVLTWTDSSGKNIPGSPTPGVNSVTSIISFTAERQAILPYTCSISYAIKGASTANGISFADNIPSSISTPLRTPTIDVVYPPEIQSLEKSENVPKCPGDTVTITCYATANPPATYSWIGPDSRNYSGPTVEANMDGIYTCTASNAIQGSTRFHTNTTTLNVSWNASETCTKDNHSPAKCRVVIIVCVVIGAYILGNIIATVVFLIYYNRNNGFKRNLNDCFTWLRKMLPCMNENVACGCGWILLSVCVFTLVGLLFLIWMIVIAKCSRGRRRSEATVKHFHNPSSTLGPNGDDTYEQINDGIHRVSQDNSKGQKKQQNGKESGKPKSVEENNSSFDQRRTAPSSPTTNPHNEAPQHLQQTTAQGPFYSELPVRGVNIQPEQFLEGNKDTTTYSELKTT